MPAGFAPSAGGPSPSSGARPVFASSGDARITGYCTVIAGRWTCWGTHRMQTLDFLLAHDL